VLEIGRFGPGRAPAADIDFETVAHVLRAVVQVDSVAVLLAAGVRLDLEVVIGPVPVAEKETGAGQACLNDLAPLDPPVAAGAELRLAIESDFGRRRLQGFRVRLFPDDADDLPAVPGD